MKMKFKTESHIRAMAETKRIPLYAYLELTYRCNLSCVHCYVDVPHAGKELSFEEYACVLDQLAEAGTLYLTLSGGEPLVRKDFLDIVKYARKLGFVIIILTNATLITDDLADKLADFFPKLVGVTLYGSREEIYARTTRRRGFFQKAVKGIRLLSERNIPMNVGFYIFNFYTAEDMLKMKRICEDLDVGWRPFFKFTARNNGDLSPIHYLVSESQLEKFSKKIPEIPRILLHQKRRNRPDINSLICGSPRCLISVSPYGQIGTCNFVLSKQSIREKPLLEIWRNDPLLQKHKELKWKDMPSCLECDDFSQCNPCPGTNFLTTGSLNKIYKPYCRYAHVMRKAYEKLIATGPLEKVRYKDKKQSTCGMV